MLTLAQRKRAARPAAVPIAVPAPVGGLNTLDALAAMPPIDAVRLDNFYPDLGRVSVRKGYDQHATGLGGTVETLAEFHTGSIRRLIGAANGNLWNATSAGAASSLGSGFTSNRWQHANFSGKLLLVNGADAPQTYDGTTLGATGWTGPTSVPALIGIHVHKERVYLWEANSQDFWYATSAAVTGALTKYPLSRVDNAGGKLVAVATLYIDGGDGPDDLIAFIMSSGQALVYAGNDPGDATAWSLVGKFQIGAPLDARAVARYGGDTWVTTRQDHTPLSAWFAAVQAGSPPPLSKASGAVLAATAAASSSFGWQAIAYPKGARLLFNVPNTDGTFHQHVRNMATGAWCRFTGMNARCWSLYNEDLYFGGAGGIVYKADSGNDDDGAAISADGQQAWSALAGPSRSRIVAVKPVVQSEGAISYSFGIGYDFADFTTAAAESSAPSTAPWDTSPWDTTPWGPDSVIDATWRAAGGGTGQMSAVRLRVAAKQAVSWLRTDFRAQAGIGL